MEKEIKIIKDRKVWELVKPSKDLNPLGCRWVYIQLKRIKMVKLLGIKPNSLLRVTGRLKEKRMKRLLVL